MPFDTLAMLFILAIGSCIAVVIAWGIGYQAGAYDSHLSAVEIVRRERAMQAVEHDQREAKLAQLPATIPTTMRRN